MGCGFLRCSHQKKGIQMKSLYLSLYRINALLLLVVVPILFADEAVARKKEPAKPGWHACGTQGLAEFDAIDKAVMKACLDIGKESAIAGTGGAAMYCKDGQHTCCEFNEAGSITSCSSVGGRPNSVLIPKRPAYGAIASDGKAPPTQAVAPPIPPASPAASATATVPTSTKKTP
jgi:hypothetical protein